MKRFYYIIKKDGNMNKEVGLFIPAFISVGLTILLVLIFTNELKLKKETEKENVSYILNIEKDDKCEGINVYTNELSTYCIKEIYYNGEQKESLRSVLNDKISLEEIINKLSILEENKDYILYEDTSNVGNVYFRILKCNNKYIIGNQDLNYQKEYCE